MKIYPDYKSIDQLWLTEIPRKWQMIKIKYAFEERSEKGYPDEPLLVASQNMGVVPKSLYGNRTVEAQKDLHLLKLVRIGDFVISLRSFQGGIEYAYYQGIISPAYTIMISKDILTSGYFRYLAKSYSFIELLKTCVTGIREGQNIDYSKLKNYRVPVPPRSEQDQIVRFLDWKVSSINKLINIKRKEIIELKSLKRSVVNHVVTHGLSPDIVMKNSGVSWLGKIPAHWEVLALKHMCSMKSGDNLTNLEIIDNGGYKVYGGNGMRGFFHRFNCENECVLIGRQGALCGNVHLVTERIWATDHAVITKAFRNISTKYLYYLLMAMNLNQYGQSTAAQPGISVGVIKNLSACLPPRIEQDQIVTYLETTNENYDKVAQIIDAEITALSELKARLISDVVTGKMDVRGIEIPEYKLVEVTEDVEADSKEIVEEELEND